MSIRKIIDYLERSFWAIPLIFTIMPFIIFIGVLEYILITNSSNIEGQNVFLFKIISNPDTARVILGVIATAVISIISISFSITILVLSIASQQYTPRLLQNFMRRNNIKIVLGLFISTFIYCLLAIALIQENLKMDQVFSILYFFGIILGILSLFAFIYFINYVIQAISVSNIINNIGEEIIATLKRFYPEKNKVDAVENIKAYDFLSEYTVLADESGYLQSINYSDLAEIAEINNLIFKILYNVGDYVIKKPPY